MLLLLLPSLLRVDMMGHEKSTVFQPLHHEAQSNI